MIVTPEIMDYQELFNYLTSIEMGRLPTETDMQEIERIVLQSQKEGFNPFSPIKFGIWLSGHDEETVEQLYNDFKNSFVTALNGYNP